jgi:nitric oxide reductase subunit B
MFGMLLFISKEIYHQAPPIPQAVKSERGDVLFIINDIHKRQNLW